MDEEVLYCPHCGSEMEFEDGDCPHCGEHMDSWKDSEGDDE
ncbi:hypothetical protein [Salmonella phage vB_SenAc-pSK20]|uniref:Uncharacterized protein n=2 Tax=Kuttervirus TaxID=2169536 RepID=A0A2P0QE85_9CAUD|nr:hypothetical protein HYP09_gp118 [Salmonella phage BSP101]YP_009888818.1 hypothetical protein HYQ36_gp095 [Salmonella phage moki]YP_009948813.1 hypothetical protein HYQ25_gp012 [Salmonella phage Se-B]UCR92385.1 hypothetical protein LPEK22_00133 [Escherichia phage LPEK22]WRQ13297.1 hypothetical protein [Salmonella phage vB_SenAc-pSK20]ARM70007.1 hypothetical protein BSP101_0170 [Salmonella phage BSP101]QIQ62368.1 hypothetical protein moki_95 [Salmonella phage moki]